MIKGKTKNNKVLIDKKIDVPKIIDETIKSKKEFLGSKKTIFDKKGK